MKVFGVGKAVESHYVTDVLLPIVADYALMRILGEHYTPSIQPKAHEKKLQLLQLLHLSMSFIPDVMTVGGRLL